MSTFNESNYENSIIELFCNLGYTHLYGPDVARDVGNPLLEMINPDLPGAAIHEAVYKIKNYEAGSLLSKNESFTDYLQIQNYKKSIEGLFIYNAFCVISDQSQTRAGTITASFDRFMEWKTVDGDYEETRYADFTTLIRGMFAKRRFLDILHHFVCFSKDSSGDAKILAAYHQYFAVKRQWRPQKKQAQTAETGGAAFSGTPRAVENLYPWCSM